MPYELYYWPNIQGRGEFVRLALEEARVAYVDVARGSPQDGQGLPAMMKLLENPDLAQSPFAPPFLKDGNHIVAQTAAILLYLAGRHDLAPKADFPRLFVHQIQLTIADAVNEAHDTHHPIGMNLYYEDQKEPALARAAEFRQSRIPKYLSYFESMLRQNVSQGHFLVGARVSYADLSLFQLVAGLSYAFPRAMTRAMKKAPLVQGHHDAIAERPHIKAYLESERRIPFNEEGIFRHYPELDG